MPLWPRARPASRRRPPDRPPAMRRSNLAAVVHRFLDQLGGFLGADRVGGELDREVVDHAADSGAQRLVEEQRVPVRARRCSGDLTLNGLVIASAAPLRDRDVEAGSAELRLYGLAVVPFDELDRFVDGVLGEDVALDAAERVGRIALAALDRGERRSGRAARRRGRSWRPSCTRWWCSPSRPSGASRPCRRRNSRRGIAVGRRPGSLPGTARARRAAGTISPALTKSAPAKPSPSPALAA